MIYYCRLTVLSSEPLGVKVFLDNLAICATTEMHHVYIDNFSSYDFMMKLTEMSFRAAGTVRYSRLKKCSITSQAELNEKPRLTADRIEMLRWYDEKTILS